MPFDRFTPRSFTVASVRANAPAASGVYGISNPREWIYIGETGNIQASLLEHLMDSSSDLMRRQPTGFVFEVCSASERPTRLERLTLEYRPACQTTRQGP